MQWRNSVCRMLSSPVIHKTSFDCSSSWSVFFSLLLCLLAKCYYIFHQMSRICWLKSKWCQWLSVEILITCELLTISQWLPLHKSWGISSSDLVISLDHFISGNQIPLRYWQLFIVCFNILDIISLTRKWYENSWGKNWQGD